VGGHREESTSTFYTTTKTVTTRWPSGIRQGTSLTMYRMYRKEADDC
jgi:hypothetical protein